MRYLVFALAMLLGPVLSARAQISVDIGIPGLNIGINMPVYPHLVRIPGYPVYYDPDVNSNYFFYDGLYWTYAGDNWYSSTWYNGPWELVEPEYVPQFLLLVPVRYYRAPPVYFRSWSRDGPPRWGEHWGRSWEQRRSGWDRWDRRSAPAAAPLPDLPAAIFRRPLSSRDRAAADAPVTELPLPAARHSSEADFPAGYAGPASSAAGATATASSAEGYASTAHADAATARAAGIVAPNRTTAPDRVSSSNNSNNSSSSNSSTADAGANDASGAPCAANGANARAVRTGRKKGLTSREARRRAKAPRPRARRGKSGPPRKLPRHKAGAARITQARRTGAPRRPRLRKPRADSRARATRRARGADRSKPMKRRRSNA